MGKEASWHEYEPKDNHHSKYSVKKKKEESNGHSRRQILKAKGEKHIIKPDKSKMA